jgi:mechanosensitive ion channel-like protein
VAEQFNRAFNLAGTRIVESVANFLPGVLVFFVLVLGALVAAVALRYALRRTLNRFDFDRRSALLGMSLAEWTPSHSASTFVASVAYWTVLTIGVLLGLTALDAALPSQFARSVLEYVPHLVAALAILVVGGIVARFLARAVLIGAVNMGFQYARLVSLTVKWLVLIVAAAMALDHIGIGRTVLLLAFGILFGGVVLALALAVGLGARDVVSRALDRQLRAPAQDDKLNHV